MENGFIRPRRAFLKTAAAAALSTVASPYLWAQGANRPLKIGFVTSLSGPLSPMGESMRSGLQLLIEEAGGQFAGRQIELITEDDQTKPDEGVRKFRKLIGQDNVDLMCGVVSSAVALAVRDVSTEAKVLTFIANGSANELARKAASPYVIRSTKTNWMLGHTAGLWLFDNVEKSGGLTFGADYVAGRELIGDFVSTYEKLGGKIAKQMWTPLGTTDFGPMLMTIAAEQPKFVYPFFAGNDAVRFLKQWSEFRLQGRIKLVGTGGTWDQEDVIPAVGDAAIGAVSTLEQSPTAPASAKFVAAYKKARGRLPGELGTGGYVTGQVMRAAIEAVGGDVSNKEKMREAILANPVDTAVGPMKFDPRNMQAILDIYVNEVRKGEDGVPVNTMIHTYKGIQDPGVAS
jgi:branched-chain amino acid transport system substrate-binding protein